MTNNQIKIHFVRADEYTSWKKNLQNFEEIMLYIRKLNLKVHLLPRDRPLSDISHMFTSDNHLFHHRYPLKNGECVFYRLFHPASGKYLNFTDTLHENGVNDNDVIVIELELPKPSVSHLLLSQPSYRIALKNIIVSKKDKNSPLAEILETGKDENPLYAILLYTEEDINIAKYVKSYYDELSKLSGKTCVFVFEKEAVEEKVYQYWSKRLLEDEYIGRNARLTKTKLNALELTKAKLYDKAVRKEVYQYWSEQLLEDEYIGWNALGLTKTKPYDKAQIYELCDIFEIPKDKVPCILFFNNLDLNDKEFIVLEFNEDEELKNFFRHVFTVCDKAVNVSPEKRIDVLTSQFKKDKIRRIISGIVKSGVIKDVLRKAVGI